MGQIRGNTIIFRFVDGPMAGKSFMHAFGADGSVEFSMGDGGTKRTRVDKCEIARVNDSVEAVSYLGPGGYTLTVVLDFSSEKLVAVSSNDKQVGVQRGTFEVQSSAQPSAH